jgi:transposase
VVRLKREHDLETLRQIALLVDGENRRLVDENVRLRVELARARGIPDTEQLRLSILRDLDKKREHIFRIDERRERKPGNGAKKKSPGHGPREQPQLPVIDKVIELAEDQRRCSVCDGELGEMNGQFEESEVVTVVKRNFVIEKHLRKKYRCRCNANVVTAPAPDKLIPGGRYSIEFAAEVAVNKYHDHLPLERQVRMMKREGLSIDSQTLWDQLYALSRHAEPTYEALKQRALSSPVVHADESGWPLLDKKKKKNESRGSVWTLSTPEVVIFRMMPSKSEEDGRKLLGSYTGTVVADGYVVYENLSRAGPYRLVNCWAHVKRHADDLEENFPAAATALLDMIKELYDVEREVGGPFPGDEQAQKRRHRLRQERSRPITEQIKKWLFAQQGLPRSELGKLVRYVLERWTALTVFLEDPLVPLDNNHAERSLRSPVLGRKNHHGSRSRRGTHVAEMFYSLCETARLHGLDPRDYLVATARHAIREPGAVTMPEDLPALTSG